MMENLLKRLFDYQKFEGNAALDALVDSVHARYGLKELEMEDMEFVSAAGTPDFKPDDQKKNPKN